MLHAHFGPVGNRFRFAKKLWHAPLLVSFHGHDFSAVPLREGPRVYAKLFETADGITVNSEFTRPWFANPNASILPGDANNDGRVNATDLGRLATRWQQLGNWSACWTRMRWPS